MSDALAAARSRCTFPTAGTPVTCAVSGGADSLAMLALATDAGLDVTAVHVDHGLRPGGEAEAAIVDAASSRFGARFRAEQVEIPPGGDLEARARRARHAVLPADALYGHTLDDQAETVMLALLRGAGLDGLSAMSADRHPILALRRSETQTICAELGLVPVQDPSNDDPRFRRNRVRHEVLPLLDEVAKRDVRPILARAAAVAAVDVAHLDALSATVDPSDASALAAAPLALARRAVRSWLRMLDADDHPPDLAAVDRVLAVARGEVVAAQVPGGIEVRRSNQRLEAGPIPERG